MVMSMSKLTKLHAGTWVAKKAGPHSSSLSRCVEVELRKKRGEKPMSSYVSSAHHLESQYESPDCSSRLLQLTARTK